MDEKLDDGWRQDELDRLDLSLAGNAVVVNKHKDHGLIEFGSHCTHAVYIGRPTIWGNPFIMGTHGNRDTVCDYYERYLAGDMEVLGILGTRKRPVDYREVLAKLLGGALCGSILVCHCYPLRCHGDTLARIANTAPNRHKHRAGSWVDPSVPWLESISPQKHLRDHASDDSQ